MEVRCMNYKNNTKIILLLSIGLLLIPGCHKSPTAEDVVLNDPFLTILFYSHETSITSDVLQSIKNKEEFKTMDAYCETPDYFDLAMDLGKFILGISNIDHNPLNSYLLNPLNMGRSILASRNYCIPTEFSSNVNFPIINGLLYFWSSEKYSAIATLEDYIKNKQIIRENYLENENTNVELSTIIVTGKVESKGFINPSNPFEYFLIIRPESMSNIKVFVEGNDRIMRKATVGDNYKLLCNTYGLKSGIIEEQKELVYTITHCDLLTPELFDIKPDQIESVTNYLNGMKQCKRNELYFDGKCLDLSQNSPELPNPGNSKPQNSEPTPPPKNPSAQAPNQYDSAAAQKNLQAIADTLFVKCNSEDEYDSGNSLCVNSKLHNSNLHDAFFTKYPCFSENDFKYFNAIVNGDNIFMGDPTDEDKWNDGIDYLNKEHTSACNDPAKHKSLVRPLEQSDRISYNDFKSKYPCLSDEDYKIYLDDFNQSISKGTLKIVFKDKTDLEYDNNLACVSKTESIADLLAHHVEQEIKLEEGKPSGQFFSIKQGLKPCLKNPNTCTTSIAPLVRESYVKFNRGIIATILLTNNDSFDINLFKEIQRTLLLPTTDSSERQRIANKSPVGREIMKATKLSAEDKNNIFSIWYLRQIPYAGEEIWKESNSSNSWDYYLNRADQYLEQVSIPTPPPTNPAAQAPVQPTAIPTSPSSTESSILYNTSGSWKIQLHGNIPTSEGQKIALLLNQWNDAMNQHNADAVAKTHTNNAIIRGNYYTIEAYRDKEAKAFKKHPDFAQSPVSDVYAAPLQNKKGYYLIFDLTFSQGGKDTRTEIMLVVLHDGVNYKIDYESDISTDRNLIKKMEMENYTLSSSKACTQLAEQILMESPQFRYDCIPDYLLVNQILVCKNDECGIGVGERGIVVENYKFDYKSMQFTIENFNDNSEYTYTIHPKYTSQIRQLCP